MKNIIKWSFINSLGTIAYIALLVTIMNAAGKSMQFKNELIAGITMLTLFVFSAAVTSSLILGRPVLMFISGQRVESIRLFVYTLGWLSIALIILLIINII